MPPPPIPALPCMCARLRRASRLLSQHYEDALRPAGSRLTQFTILQLLSIAGEVTQKRMGRMLGMDTTTLTRTLTAMSRQGWIDKQRGEDRREWKMRLSKKGHAQFVTVQPLWKKAQDSAQQKLGTALSDGLMNLANDVTRTLMQQGESS
jgi:DNA-binding MarR family transcriptional regulator